MDEKLKALKEELKEAFFRGDEFRTLSVSQCLFMGEALAEHLDIPLLGEKTEKFLFGLIVYAIELSLITSTNSSIIDYMSAITDGIDLKTIEDKVCGFVHIPLVGESKERVIVSSVIHALSNFTQRGAKLL